ncbi:hypothetical protein BFW01_g12280 [Lasiodiplodia theobromae]|nr:hypothetical protein BFW01_g12280 [Lasiodiplodia theobromae]
MTLAVAQHGQQKTTTGSCKRQRTHSNLSTPHRTRNSSRKFPTTTTLRYFPIRHRLISTSPQIVS